ncbi:MULTISPECIES: MotA/TolQ/ExbB proton channel family protein [Spirosoma]|uniref:MotA/TolQ/ExbB proton channel family protein n=1 Tax=Spirosoma TaxID=107 RepID=UPI00037745A3|nr:MULTISPECIES: MotA/TolQ/ExbB proton channel family protein [Spirosoma]MBN8824820.1 MotA/TolQ/ExbB proton channel family protein [Spirosoma sp.]OJW77031.1 MAG: biopolymer transporter ExbB [Spirosoma sp. 48-14]
MLLLQVPAVDTTAASLSATAGTQTQSLQLFDLVAKGGWVMIPIAILFFAALYLIFERYFVIRSQSKTDANFIDNIRDMVAQGNIRSAESFAKNQRTAMGRVFEKAIGRIGSPIREIESTIETVGQIELSRLERNMGYLGIIAGIAPMMGFIGTISGIIRIFYDISLSDNISVGIIAGGLYEKMITSGAGLIVGVIAYTGYHLLNMMIERFTLALEINAFEFIEVLQKPTNEPARVR